MAHRSHTAPNLQRQQPHLTANGASQTSATRTYDRRSPCDKPRCGVHVKALIVPVVPQNSVKLCLGSSRVDEELVAEVSVAVHSVVHRAILRGRKVL
eukprot:5017966-Prymnesium_polylepis.1